jgi:hypothetical protein
VQHAAVLTKGVHRISLSWKKLTCPQVKNDAVWQVPPYCGSSCRSPGAATAHQRGLPPRGNGGPGLSQRTTDRHAVAIAAATTATP